ncbi:MAG: hypothetical protein FJ315_03360, partial [SAR202 cluster bacterium]|nr:hypothetical protein [SAR202 cluster bacterium]
MAKSTLAPSGATDAQEAQHWLRCLSPAQLYELHQPFFTHEGPISWARLDRVYVNAPVSDQLDKRVFCSALEWQRDSQHRPVAFGRTSTPSTLPLMRPIPEAIIDDPSWATQVSAEFLSMCECPERLTPLLRLRKLKAAIRMVSARGLGPGDTTSAAPSPKDHLTIVMSALRRLERGGSICLEELRAQVPLARSLLGEFTGLVTPLVLLEKLRHLAETLAKEQLGRDLQELHSQKHALADEVFSRRKDSLARRLKQLAPGRSASTLSAVSDSRGVVHTDGVGMADALRDHWQRQFAAKPSCSRTRAAWLRDDRASPEGLHHALAPFLGESRWRVRRCDVAKAINRATCSAPGPDGIPYLAWQRLGDLGVSVLHEALDALMAEDGREALLEAFPLDSDGNSPFNEALLVMIPKKASATTEHGAPLYEPCDVRPLSVVNTDNRLLANAVRLRVEPLLAQAVCPQQQGFLPDRSLLSNVIDIDTDMQEASLLSEEGGAVFFHFAAAFPSVSHAFLHDALEHLGVPKSFQRFVDILYLGNGCRLALQGGHFPGFPLRSGIRQGCPLSPLLFALCGDLLLRRLAARLPSDTIRAYADDVALVSRNIFGSCQIFGPIFEEFARLSGMVLNLQKTVFVPLSDGPLDHFRARLAGLHPRWSAAACRFWAAYLGFVLGPEGRDRSWAKALEKYAQRAALWASVGLGLQYTAAAYNTYIVSTLGFLVQLEPIPAQWEAFERAALRRLAPGPAHWIRPADLRSLRQTYHFPLNFVDLRATSVAARFRVMHRTALASGGLRVRQRLRRLESARSASDALVRQARWAQWFRQPMLALLEAARTEMKELGHSCESLEASLARGPRPHTQATARLVHRGLQRAAVSAVAATARSADQLRLRRRLERWDLPLVPRIRVTRALRVCARLRSLIPPRVQAAVIRT